MTSFIVHALPAGEADQSGPAGRLVVADGPSPCRRCLRNAAVGDELILLPYDPEPDALPEQVHGRQFSVRAYDEEAMMVDAFRIDRA